MPRLHPLVLHRRPLRRSEASRKEFQSYIFSWWKIHRRNLPWRGTHDPYKILVSEVMLQQTQVPRVLARYAEFIEAYPTVRHLAKASTAYVLKIWKGMGYNKRALYLHKAAKVIVDQYHSKFPVSEQLLSKLPGLGTYTARALLVFAFSKDVAAVDTNIRQIITHFFFDDTPQKESIIQDVADQLVPKGKSWEWHQALMDFGALEMPKLKIKKLKKTNSIPFKETNRYFRGRIMDTLREGNITQSALVKDCIDKYGKSKSYFVSILEGLTRDGLLVRSNGNVSLPGREDE